MDHKRQVPNEKVNIAVKRKKESWGENCSQDLYKKHWEMLLRCVCCKYFLVKKWSNLFSMRTSINQVRKLKSPLPSAKK